MKEKLNSVSGWRLIIAGSRDITDIKHLLLALWAAPYSFGDDCKVVEVVSGGASGVDLLGEQWAEKHDIPIKRFIPDWEKHGKAAGPIRNAQMAEYADALLAIWDGKSRGTKNMIEEMQKRGKSYHIWEVKP